MPTDQFGITTFYATKTSGREWFSKWANSVPRILEVTGSDYDLPPTSGRNQDPQDPEFIEMMNGPNRWSIDGTSGIAIWRQVVPGTSGDCRPYIIDYPAGVNSYDIGTQNPPRKTWQNIEMTAYIRLMSLDPSYDVPTPGSFSRVIRLCGRSNHFNIEHCLCDAKGYDFQLEYTPTDDSLARISKEIIHDLYTSPANTSLGLPVTDFDHTHGIASYTRFGQVDNFPLLRWIGLKLIIRNIASNGRVRLECYRDMLDGLNGGSWVKLFEIDDDGIDGNWGARSSTKRNILNSLFAGPDGCGETEVAPFACIEDPTPYEGNYNPIISRAGYACYIRCSGFSEVQLKKFSIREIDGLATP